MIEKIYANSEEKFVKTIVFYASTDEGVLTVDADGAVKVTKDELLRAFLTGLVIKMEDTYYKPISFAESAGAGVVKVALEDTAVKMYTFYSTEHEA